MCPSIKKILITALFWEWCVHRWQKKTDYISLLGMMCTLMTAGRWLTFPPPTCSDSLHQIMDLRFSTIPAMTCPRHSETPVHIQCLYSLENYRKISFIQWILLSWSHPFSNHTSFPIPLKDYLPDDAVSIQTLPWNRRWFPPIWLP